MSKFYGTVGFGTAQQVETSPGVWEVLPIERNYFGDILNNVFRSQNTENLNDDIVITNRISILADPYALNNFHQIKYVKWMGIAWKVNSVEEQFPRLILNLGGTYNGEQAI